MKILVVGANGYTGSRLVRELIRQGHAVRGLVRRVEEGIALEKEGMDLRLGDLTYEPSLQGIADGCEIVFNLVAACRLEPSESKTILGEGLQNLFRVVDRTALKKYVWTSNVSVYGSPKASERLTETSPLKPAYTLGKQTVDAEKFSRESVPAIAVRVPALYGPRRDYLAALKEQRLRLLNGGENWTSRIHADDLVRVLVAVMERGTAGGVYLASDDMPTIQREFFAEIASAAAAPVPLSLEVNAARAYGVFGRAMNALAGERQYQLSENVIGLLSGNYYCLNNRIKNELGVRFQYPTFREGYKAIFAERQGHG